MKRFLLCAALCWMPTCMAQAQGPDAATIQRAMNEGLGLEFPFFQEFTDVQVLRGGATQHGDYLFLCKARLTWKLSSSEFAALMEQETMQEQPQEGADDTLFRALAIVLASKLERIGEFQRGDTVADVRFRVRLEQGGVDWIVAAAKVKESKRNPLNIIDQGDP